MLALGAVLTAAEGTPRSALVAAAAGGAGLCLAAFGKPPLFAFAVLGFAVMAAVAPRARVALTIALLFGLALICAVAPPAELVGLVRRILATQRLLGLPNALQALPAKIVRDWSAVPLSLTLAAVATGLSLLPPRSPRTRWLGYAAVALIAGYGPHASVDLIDGDLPDFIGLALVIAGAAYAGAVALPLADRLAVAALLVAPAAVALGTFNNQWGQLNFSMVFPLLALFKLACADPKRWRAGAVQAGAVAAPVAVMLLAALRPYSLPASIFEQQAPIEAPLSRGRLLVDPQTAAFVGAARGLARGDLLLDLSGTGPGVAAVLGAHAPVLPWLNPATPAWPDVVWSRLSARERATASFVLPAWPTFDRSAPAVWIARRKAGYCRRPLPPMTFWREARVLELWRPCGARP
jgi:hypothetical protein